MQDDLSVPLCHEELEGSCGLLFPFYDCDTNMVYVAGKGDGNIQYYEVSCQKPYLHCLNEYRSQLPQKGIGVLPKRGVDVNICEIFRFYKLVTVKSLIEPVSMIVPRRSDSYQDDIYPMTAGIQPALTAHEWLSGINREPIKISLRPGSKMALMQIERTKEEPSFPIMEPIQVPKEKVPAKTLWEIEYKAEIIRSSDRLQDTKKMLSNGFDLFECPPPKTENELLQMFYKQQEEIRKLRDHINQRDVQIKQLELEIKNIRNTTVGY